MIKWGKKEGEQLITHVASSQQVTTIIVLFSDVRLFAGLTCISHCAGLMKEKRLLKTD